MHPPRAPATRPLGPRLTSFLRITSHAGRLSPAFCKFAAWTKKKIPDANEQCNLRLKAYIPGRIGSVHNVNEVLSAVREHGLASWSVAIRPGKHATSDDDDDDDGHDASALLAACIAADGHKDALTQNEDGVTVMYVCQGVKAQARPKACAAI